MSNPVLQVNYFGGPWDGLSCAVKPGALELGDRDEPSAHEDGYYLVRAYTPPLTAPAGMAAVRFEWVETVRPA
jgi:hypothetical protein